jgi:hypothetical protein
LSSLTVLSSRSFFNAYSNYSYNSDLAWSDVSSLYLNASISDLKLSTKLSLFSVTLLIDLKWFNSVYYSLNYFTANFNSPYGFVASFYLVLELLLIGDDYYEFNYPFLCPLGNYPDIDNYCFFPLTDDFEEV